MVADVDGQFYEDRLEIGLRSFWNRFSQISEWQSLLTEMDHDADLYQFWFYIPVDYSELKANLAGYFLYGDDEAYITTLMPPNGDSEFDRGTVRTGYFYHLQAEHTYTATLYAMFDAGSSSDFTTYNSGVQTFMTRKFWAGSLLVLFEQ